MVQLNNYARGHELLDLLMNQGKTKQQKKTHTCRLLYLCLIYS